jgi:hypothetical protein
MKKFTLAAFVLPLVPLACTEWHTSPRAADSSYPPDRVPRARITLSNGATLEIRDARIRPDSVVGIDPVSASPVAAAITQVSRIESEEFSESRTLWLFASLGAAFLATTLYVVAHNK